MKKHGMAKNLLRLSSLAMLSFVLVMASVSTSHAEWKHGIGTGIFGLNIDGDVGTHLPNAGSIQLQVDLDAGDTSDLMESAFGFGAYSTNGTWLIQYSYANLELEDSKSHSLPVISSTVNFLMNFEATTAEATIGYLVVDNPSAKIHLDAGVRYIEHDISSTLTVSGVVNEVVNRNINEDWTDFLIGATINVPIVPKWTWNTRANAGFGGSEGTYMAQTGVNWRFLENWSTMLYGKYTAVEYENGSRGTSGWYLYDVDEFGLGLNVLYNF